MLHQTLVIGLGRALAIHYHSENAASEANIYTYSEVVLSLFEHSATI